MQVAPFLLSMDVDNLCHTLVGGALARAGLGRRTPRAALTLMVAANLPDLDALAIFSDSALGFRRGVTHGVPALVALPLLLTGLMLLWDQRRARPGAPRARPIHVLLLAGIGTLSHPMLDWLNVYGVRWLMPFNGRWFYGDAVFIMDPWLWGVLGLGWILAGAPNRSPIPARAALVVATAYLLAMVAITTVGRRVAARDLGLAAPGPRELQVAPPFFASWRREVIVRSGDRYRFGEIIWRPSPHLVLYDGEWPTGLEDLPLVTENPPPALRHFLDWARFPFAERRVRQGRPVLRLDDVRYARNGPSFAARYLPLTGW